MRTAALGDIAAINPSPPADVWADASRRVSFVPMASVSVDGVLVSAEDRTVAGVTGGHTYFERGDILLAKITPCFENGKAALVEALPHEIGFGSTEFHVIRPGPDVEPRYLFHQLWNPAFRAAAASSMTGTAGQRRVPSAFLRRHLVAVPPLNEQRRVAAILDTSDSIGRGRRRATALLTPFLQSAFLESLGDPVSNSRGWAKHRLGEVGEVQGGLQVSASRAGLPLEVPYLRVANVYRDRLDLQQVKTMPLTSTELDRTRLASGDLLIVEGHGNPAEIGRCAVWAGSVDPCVHQNHLIRVRLDRSIAEPAFVSAFLNSAGGRQQMLRFGKTTSGLNTISTSNVKSCAVPLPPLEMQRKYSELVARTNGLAAPMELAAATTARLAAVLSRLALDGVLVPEAVVLEGSL